MAPDVASIKVPIKLNEKILGDDNLQHQNGHHKLPEPGRIFYHYKIWMGLKNVSSSSPSRSLLLDKKKKKKLQCP